MYAFFGNAVIASGNGSRLLANSTIYLANGTIIANGASAIPFTSRVLVNAGTNGGNIAFIPAGNAAVAANIPFAAAYPAASGAELIIDSFWQQVNGSNVGDANAIYLAASAATFVNIAGV